MDGRKRKEKERGEKTRRGDGGVDDESYDLHIFPLVVFCNFCCFVSALLHTCLRFLFPLLMSGGESEKNGRYEGARGERMRGGLVLYTFVLVFADSLDGWIKFDIGGRLVGES